MVFPPENMFCSTEVARAVAFRKLFILFTEILLKSRVCLQDPPPLAQSRLLLSPNQKNLGVLPY
jgi:hypothetical protein